MGNLFIRDGVEPPISLRVTFGKIEGLGPRPTATRRLVVEIVCQEALRGRSPTEILQILREELPEQPTTLRSVDRYTGIMGSMGIGIPGKRPPRPDNMGAEVKLAILAGKSNSQVAEDVLAKWPRSRLKPKNVSNYRCVLRAIEHVLRFKAPSGRT